MLPRARWQLVVVGVATVVSLIGAVAWSRAVGDDGADFDDDVVLDETGEFVDPAGTNPPVTSDTLPDVELETADGTAVRLRSDGRPMVVNLWYSTCPPCARELPAFAAVHEELGDRVRFVGVNPHDTVEAMERFAADRGVTYDLLRDPDFELTNALGVIAFPVTLFVGPDGTIVGQHGTIDGPELRESIAAHWGIG